MGREVNELAALARRGDEAAMTELYRAYYKKGTTIAWQYVANLPTAEDMFQDAFLKAMTHIENFDETKQFAPWMDVIIVNTCKNYLAKKDNKDVVHFSQMSSEQYGTEDPHSYVNSFPSTDMDGIPEEALDMRILRDIMGQIVDGLPEEQREAVVLYYYKEMPIRKIANRKNVSEETIKSRLNYARKKIKDEVEGYERSCGVKLHSYSPIALLILLLRWTGKKKAMKRIVRASKVATGGAAGKGIWNRLFGTAAGRITIGAFAAVLLVPTAIVIRKYNPMESLKVFKKGNMTAYRGQVISEEEYLQLMSEVFALGNKEEWNAASGKKAITEREAALLVLKYIGDVKVESATESSEITDDLRLETAITYQFASKNRLDERISYERAQEILENAYAFYKSDIANRDFADIVVKDTTWVIPDSAILEVGKDDSYLILIEMDDYEVGDYVAFSGQNLYTGMRITQVIGNTLELEACDYGEVFDTYRLQQRVYLSKDDFDVAYAGANGGQIVMDRACEEVNGPQRAGFEVYAQGNQVGVSVPDFHAMIQYDTGTNGSTFGENSIWSQPMISFLLEDLEGNVIGEINNGKFVSLGNNSMMLDLTMRNFVIGVEIDLGFMRVGADFDTDFNAFLNLMDSHEIMIPGVAFDCGIVKGGLFFGATTQVTFSTDVKDIHVEAGMLVSALFPTGIPSLKMEEYEDTEYNFAAKLEGDVYFALELEAQAGPFAIGAQFDIGAYVALSQTIWSEAPHMCMDGVIAAPVLRVQVRDMLVLQGDSFVIPIVDVPERYGEDSMKPIIEAPSVRDHIEITFDDKLLPHFENRGDSSKCSHKNEHQGGNRHRGEGERPEARNEEEGGQSAFEADVIVLSEEATYNCFDLQSVERYKQLSDGTWLYKVNCGLLVEDLYFHVPEEIMDQMCVGYTFSLQIMQDVELGFTCTKEDDSYYYICLNEDAASSDFNPEEAQYNKIPKETDYDGHHFFLNGNEPASWEANRYENATFLVKESTRTYYMLESVEDTMEWVGYEYTLDELGEALADGSFDYQTTYFELGQITEDGEPVSYVTIGGFELPRGKSAGYASYMKQTGFAG